MRLEENSPTSFLTAMSSAADCASANVSGHSKLHKNTQLLTELHMKLPGSLQLRDNFMNFRSVRTQEPVVVVVVVVPSGRGPAYSGPIRSGIFITGPLR